jgi:DNA-binding NarL/FixJ family response regulator
MEWDGRVAEASQWWEERGYPIEAAVTRAMIPDANLEAVFSGLSGLGADGVIRGLRRELQRRGVARIPRGQREATRQNPSGLTERQAEVLSLMVSGLSNAAIAEKLFISEKTASHHVSAVLAKLNVSSRLQAVARVNSAS